MIAVELRFTAGRFHATPWGRHVNEGAAEWPPSPWRLLRALVAVWHRKRPDIPSETVKGLLNALAAAPPVFFLPPATMGHTRHFLRRYKPGTSDMVFDAFVCLDPAAPVVFCWPDLELPADRREALEALLGDMAYFGRAESWVEARLNPDWEGRPNCFPRGHEQAAEGGETVQVLAPMPAHEFDAWRATAFPQAEEAALERKRAKDPAKDPAKAKLSPKERATLEATYPEDLLAALHAETTDLRKQGWLTPPGGAKVAYRLPPGALRARQRVQRPRIAIRPTVARFALAGPVLPPLTDCVYLAETMRQALMSWSDAAEVFAGKDERGAPLEGHRHAFILPADDDDDGRLDHLVVHCREGFGEEALRALAGVRRLWQASGRPDLHLALIGLGEPEHYGGHDARAGLSPLLAASRVWVSRTPFLLTRHPKLRKDGAPRLRADGTWADGPVEQVSKALEGVGWPAPTAVERRDCTEAAGRQVRWLDFARERRRGHAPPVNTRGWGFVLRFEEEVRGPVALGYGSHFGLGQFVAMAD